MESVGRVKSMKALQALKELEEKICDFYQRKDITISHKLDEYSRSNMFSVIRNNDITNLYVKFSALDPGFWGLDSAVIKLLENAYQNNRRWMVVLLLGCPDEGYLLPRNEVLRCARKRHWSISKDKQYKVHQGELAAGHKFNSVGEMLRRANI